MSTHPAADGWIAAEDNVVAFGDSPESAARKLRQILRARAKASPE